MREATLCSFLGLILALCVSVVVVANADTPTKPAATNSKTKNATHGPASSLVKPAVIMSATPTPVTQSSSSTIVKPGWTNLPLYTDPANEATAYYQSDPGTTGAGYIKREGEVPTANWFGDWNADVQSDVDIYVGAAAAAHAVPVLVLYNIPQRDCGSYSAGGAASASAYTNWIQKVSTGIGGRLAVVVLEPDAVAGLGCLSSADQQSRYAALSQAITILKLSSNTAVYLDAGNPAWQPATVMAQRLRATNIAQADGFSLNVSNYVGTARSQSYGNQLSRLVGNKHFVIDTSRNGNNATPPDEWCNSSTAALGSTPTANTGDPLNDALLWVKLPWESDGTCNGAPPAGMVYWSFAIQLAKNAGW